MGAVCVGHVLGTRREAAGVTAAAVGALLLFAAFTGYLFLVLRRTAGAPPVPCGCGLGGAPLTVWSVARAGMLTALAGTTLLGGTMEGGGGLDPAAPACAVA